MQLASSSESAYQRIKTLIVSNEKAAGARLREDALAAELGLSRTPVRDALRRLQSEGLVVVVPNSGARVASIDSEEFSELLSMRSLLEGFSAETAARKIDNAAIEQMQLLSNEAEAIASTYTADRLFELFKLDLEFHRTVARSAANPRLLASLESIWTSMVMNRNPVTMTKVKIEQSLGHHREIIEALKAHDPDWAGSIMRTHLHPARYLSARR